MEASTTVVSSFSNEEEEEEELDEEDEFAFVNGNPASPIPADEIFHNGQIKPIYQFLLSPGQQQEEEEDTHGVDHGKISNPRPRLKALMRRQQQEEEEGDQSSSCSSSEEADDLAPPETCCMWNPNRDHRCVKSKSTGSCSRRWKLKDLLLHLKRSNSQGTTAGVVLLGPANQKGGDDTKKHEGQVVEYYVRQQQQRRRNMIQQQQQQRMRKSFLPYRQDLLLAGFFSLTLRSSSS